MAAMQQAVELHSVCPSPFRLPLLLDLTFYITASPMIAGLVAYFRGLPSEKWSSALRDPSNVAQLVRNLVRPLTINDPDTQSTDGAPDSLVWNGQIEGESCLVKNIQGCPSWLSPGGGSGSGGSAGGSQYTFEQGSPSPTCTAGCGVLCTGYYCDAEPTGSPPDFGKSPILPVKIVS